MAGERDVSLRNMNFAKVERGGGRLIGRGVFTDKYGNLKTYGWILMEFSGNVLNGERNK